MFRSACLSLLLLGLCAAPVSAQQWAEKMFDSTQVDFGPVARGANVEHRFKIKNLYQEDVHIASVRSSCGCTQPQLTKDLIKTHEETEVVARFNTQQFKGAHQATVTVTIDRPYFAEVRLNVKGYVRSDVVFHPGKVDFGTVSSGQPAERKIALAYAGRSDWKIEDVRSVNPHLQVEMAETARNGGRVNYDLLVRLLPDAPSGYLNGDLIVVTNDTRMPQVPLAVEGRVAPQLTVSPSALHLGVVKPGETVTKQIVVKGAVPFRVLKVECPAAGFSFKLDEESKKLHLIPVEFTAGQDVGKILEQIEIVTDQADQNLPPITAQAEVAAD